MSRINESSGSSSFEAVHESEAEAAGEAKKAEAKVEAKVEEQPQKKEEGDSYEAAPVAARTTISPQQTAAALMPRLPEPPRQIPLFKLEGDAREAAIAKNRESYAEYAKQYSAYLAGARTAMENVKSPLVLKHMSPELPAQPTGIPKPQYESAPRAYLALREAHEQFVKGKSDRMHDLLAMAKPNSVSLTGKAEAFAGAIKLEKKGTLDSRGAHAEGVEKLVEPEAKIGHYGAGGTWGEHGLEKVKVDLGIATFKVGKDGTGTIEVEALPHFLKAVASFNAEKGTLSAGVKVEQKGELFGNKVGIEGEVAVQYKGLSRDEGRAIGDNTFTPGTDDTKLEQLMEKTAKKKE